MFKLMLRSVFLLLLLAACGQSSGCGGCASGPPFPDKDRVHSAVQVRLTEHGVGFLEDNLEPLLSQALPEGLNICLPGQGGDIIGLVQWGFCGGQCPDGTVGCPIDIAIGNVDLELVETSRIRATLTFQQFDAIINVFANPIVDCTLAIHGPGFPISVDLNLSTPDPTRDLTFAIENPVYQLANLDIRLQNNGGALGFLCDAIDGLINFPFIGDFLLTAVQGFIDGQLVGIINGFVEDFTCRACETDVDCPSAGGALCEGGRCMLDGQCIPAQLGVEGALDVGAMLSSFSPGLKAVVQYLITPGSYVEVENQGLSLGIIAGARADKNRCVPDRPQPPLDMEPPRAVALTTSVDPLGRPYEVGIGISDLFVKHGLWAVFSAGTLCLSITSDTIEQISVSTFSLFLRDLPRLTRGAQALAITMSPQEVPIATFGANTTEPDPENEGQYRVLDPLMTLEIPDLWLDFHAFIEGRWVRIFSLSTDVTVPIAVAFSPDNGIIPVLGDLSMALRNVVAHNGEVMRDDPNALAAILPALIGPLLPSLVGGLSAPVQLPDVLGYALNLQEGSITGIENNTFLGIFADLERIPVEEMAMQARFSVNTFAEAIEVHIPETADFEASALATGETSRRPHVRIHVDALDGTTDEAPMEYQWRVDQGTWSAFTPAQDMVIRSPMLWWQGKHQIEVRARRIDDYRSLDATPAVLNVIIDSVAPELTLTRQGSHAKARISDIVNSLDELVLTVRIGDGDFKPLSSSGVRLADEDGSPIFEIDAHATERVEVRAVDQAGNTTEAVLVAAATPLIGRASHEERTNPAAAAGGCGDCGCILPGRGGAPGPFALLGLAPLLVGLVLRRRGQSARVVLAALFAVAALLGACDDSTAGREKGADDMSQRPESDGGDMGMVNVGECQTDEDCGDGRVCRLVAGVNRCILLGCDDDPDACTAISCDNGAPALCAATGMCECGPPCPDGCPDGQFCCRANAACEPLPEACAGLTCDAGYEPMVFAQGMVSEDSCLLENGQCLCIEKHPIELGSIGRFSDFALHAGQAHFSAYADTYGDLVVGSYNADDQTFQWTFVDGVPEGAEVVGAPSGPRGGVKEDGDDVGTDTAIAASLEGNLHVAYRDVTNQSLKYALGIRAEDGTYSFTKITLDLEGDAGRWASISVDARGVPGIAYRVARRHDADAWVSEVRYLLAKNPTPATADDWLAPFTLTRSVLDAPCGGLCDRSEACLAATDACVTLTNQCGMCGMGEACVEGACQAVVEVPPAPPGYPEGTGLFTTQTRDLQGFPVVAWYDRTFGQLWSSRFAEAGFGEPQQLAGYGVGVPSREGDMGSNVDLTVDAMGNTHLCFQDGLTDSLRYLAPELGIDELVDDGIREDDGRSWAVHVVGEDCNVRFDAAGLPLIVYQDATSQDLLVTRRTPEGVWMRQTIRGAEFEYIGAFGFYTRARTDGARLWVSSFTWNARTPGFPEGLDVLVSDL